jgi:hypothetical protein
MDLAGLISNVLISVALVDRGRRGLSTDGDEHEGRLSYEEGIAGALKAFSVAVSTCDPKTIMLVEEAFVEQELHYCSEEDSHTRSSMIQALHSFDDAFLCLEAVEDSAVYKVADKTWPHKPTYRVKGFPRDALHLACIAHRTRIANSLRTPGINMREKALLQQRIANMAAVQRAYIEKQRKALEHES